MFIRPPGALESSRIHEMPILRKIYRSVPKASLPYQMFASKFRHSLDPNSPTKKVDPVPDPKPCCLYITILLKSSIILTFSNDSLFIYRCWYMSFESKRLQLADFLRLLNAGQLLWAYEKSILLSEQHLSMK